MLGTISVSLEVVVLIPGREGQLGEVTHGVLQFSKDRAQEAEGIGSVFSTQSEKKLDQLGVLFPVLHLNDEAIHSFLHDLVDLVQAQPEVSWKGTKE